MNDRSPTTLRGVQQEYREWHDARFPDGPNVGRSMMKLTEEVGELVHAYDGGDRSLTLDAVGDVYITLLGLSYALAEPLPARLRGRSSQHVAVVLGAIAHNVYRSRPAIDHMAELVAALNWIVRFLGTDLEAVVANVWREVRRREKA